MDEFEKIIAQSNKNECVKERILIVHLRLGFEEAHHPCLRDRYEYYAVKTIEHFVKVCLPITKKKNLLKISDNRTSTPARVSNIGGAYG